MLIESAAEVGMSFQFISESQEIAGQMLPWALGIGVAGAALLVFSLTLGKPLAYSAAGGLLILAAALVGTRAYYLNQSQGQWRIYADSERIEWESPDARVDHSFSLSIQDLRHILVESWEGMTEAENQYTLVTRTGSYKLRKISGVNLKAFTDYLVSQGVTTEQVVHETAKP